MNKHKELRPWAKNALYFILYTCIAVDVGCLMILYGLR